MAKAALVSDLLYPHNPQDLGKVQGNKVKDDDIFGNLGPKMKHNIQPQERIHHHVADINTLNITHAPRPIRARSADSRVSTHTGVSQTSNTAPGKEGHRNNSCSQNQRQNANERRAGTSHNENRTDARKRNPKREPNPSDPSSSDSSDDTHSSEEESGANSQAGKERNKRKKHKNKNRCKSEASFGAWRTKPSDDSDEEVMRQSSVI